MGGRNLTLNIPQFSGYDSKVQLIHWLPPIPRSENNYILKSPQGWRSAAPMVDTHLPPALPLAPSKLHCYCASHRISVRCKEASSWPLANVTHSHLFPASGSALTAPRRCHNQLFVRCFRWGVYMQLGTCYCVLTKKILSLLN